MVGREVKTLVDEQEEAGEKAAKFNAIDLASGMYFYRISTEEFSETRKMILLR